MLRILLGVPLLAFGVLLAIAGPAEADCAVVNPRTGLCQVEVEDPSSGGGGGSGGGTVTDSSCYRNGEKIPCSQSQGGIDAVWFGNCYGMVVEDPETWVPADQYAAHEDDEGQWYMCVDVDLGTFHWLGGSDPVPPNPADLAARAVDTMTLKAIPIGIVPEDRPGKVGIVGMPVWMWSESRAASVVGPITKTASVGAYSVTATARLARVVWTMGDGKTVICAGSNAMGTPYEDRFDTQSSPSCGHRYNQPGRYEIRATSHWEVQWSGIGQSGTITLELYDTTNVRISEVQVLNQ